MSASSLNKMLLLSAIAFMLLSSALALPFKTHPQHRHRKHLNRPLFTNNYSVKPVDGRMERAPTVATDSHEVTLVRQQPRTYDLMKPNLLLRPDRTAQHFKNGDARIYRIAAAESRLRTSPFNDGMSSTMKKILLRMN